MRIPPTSIIAAAAAGVSHFPAAERPANSAVQATSATPGEVVNPTGESSPDRDANGQYLGHSQHDHPKKKREEDAPQTGEDRLQMPSESGHLDLWG